MPDRLYTEAELQAAVEQERQRARVGDIENDLADLKRTIKTQHAEVLRKFDDIEDVSAQMREHIIKSQNFDRVAPRIGEDDWKLLPNLIEDFRVNRARQKRSALGIETTTNRLIGIYHRIAIPMMFASMVISIVAIVHNGHQG